MTELTLERLVELEALEKEATPGPWRAGSVERDDQLIAAMRNELPALLAAARRDADVRALDEWAADRERDEGPETASHTTRRPTNPNRGEWVTHLFSGYEGDEDQHDFHGATPEEARAKAAAWVREQGIESGKGGEDGNQ